MNADRRVFITGFGPVCSLGDDRRTFWGNLLAGRSGIAPVARLAGAPVTYGAEVGDFRPEGILASKELRLDRVAQFAIVAAHRAMEDAGMSTEAFNPQSAIRNSQSPVMGVVLGTSRGAAELLESHHRRFVERGAEGVSPRASPATTAGNLGGATAIHFGLRGPCLTVSAACSSAAQAIGVAFDWVRRGRAEVMLAGGAEACLTPFCMAMFAAAGILSRRPDDPEGASRPFDRDRDGIVIGEGAGIAVLESEAHARARGARPYCELKGYGASCDALSLAGVPEDGEGLVRAVRSALSDAGVLPEAVDYVNAHATGTRDGDRAEAAALRSVFGGGGRGPAVSSTKSATGHLIGAAGGIEAGICALAVAEGVMPPTLHLRNPDPACELNHIAGGPLRKPVGIALSCSMGFGGNNACLVFGGVR
jgi:3-oxoacyl-[acyl-carrier-protein] synthase II